MNNVEKETRDLINIFKQYQEATEKNGSITAKSLNYLADYTKRKLDAIDIFMSIDGELALLKIFKYGYYDKIIDIIIKGQGKKINKLEEKYELMEILVKENRIFAISFLIVEGWKINEKDKSAKKLLEKVVLAGNKIVLQSLTNTQKNFNFALEIRDNKTLSQIVFKELETNVYLSNHQKNKLENLLNFLKVEETKSLNKILEKDLTIKENKSSKLKI